MHRSALVPPRPLAKSRMLAPEVPFPTLGQRLLRLASTAWLFLLLTMGSSLGLGSCRSLLLGPTGRDIYTPVTARTLPLGSPIPLPQGEVILTVTGKVGNTNVGETIQLDRATIESLGTVAYRVIDPFEQIENEFEGVLMTDLLALWQVSEDAQSLHLTALNDYQVEIPLAEFSEYPILFALKTNGKYMKPDYRGPAMLVLPYAHYDFDRIYTDEYWIWQIESIIVR